MGDYVTQTGGAGAAGDLTSRIGNARLTLICDDGTGNPSTTVIASAIADGEADLNSILGPGFDVPMSATVAPIIIRCAVDMVMFYLYENNPEFRITGGDNPEQKRYDRAVKILKEIKSGDRDLGRDTGVQRSAIVGGVVYASTTTYIVDEDETSDGATGGL